VDAVSGRVTEIREPGPTLREADAAAFEAHFLSLLDAGVSVVTLSGSLPPGLPQDFYARLIRAAAGRGVPCVLDGSGEALRLGVEAVPWAVKVNQAELLELGCPGAGAEPGAVEANVESGATESGGEVDMPHSLSSHLARVVESGVVLAVVTRGREGLLAFDGHALWWACPPAGLTVVQPVGSGDAATAALAVRLARWLAEGRLASSPGGRPGTGFAGLPESERVALILDMVAAGAVNAVTEGIGTCPPALFATLRDKVTVEVVI
jgi:fructose-1-phosphate kinase PfkB-like protein